MTPELITLKYDEALPRWITFCGKRPVTHELTIQCFTNPLSVTYWLNGEAVNETKVSGKGIKFITDTRKVTLVTSWQEINNAIDVGLSKSKMAWQG